MPQKQSKPAVLPVAGSNKNLKLVSRQLEPFFRVMTANDAESAWESWLEFGNITLLISELNLVIDGFGLLERLPNASDSRLSATLFYRWSERTMTSQRAKRRFNGAQPILSSCLSPAAN